jgi:hypothetical protein
MSEFYNYGMQLIFNHCLNPHQYNNLNKNPAKKLSLTVTQAPVSALRGI